MEPSEQEHREFVPAVFARSVEEAEQYCDLLDDHDIPAIVGDEEVEGAKNKRTGRMSRGVPVLVPEALLDEASEIIADRENVDEFEVDEEEAEEEEEEEDEELELEGEEALGLDDLDDSFEDEDLLDEDEEEDSADDEDEEYEPS